MMRLRTSDASAPTLSSRFLTLQKARQEARGRFLAGRKAETQYARQLRQVAKQVGDLVRGMAPDGVVADVTALVEALNRYAHTLQPWAQSVASRMIADVSRRDAAAWEKHGKLIGQLLRKEIDSAPTGAAMRAHLAEQMQYITSIPREAAERVHRLTTEGISKGTRATEIAKEIMRSGEVSKSSAMRLARTGVSSTATALTKARAQHIGSEGYFWRTSKDGDVRPSHKAMEGKFVRWDDPPTIDGFTGHCGEAANCRCFPEPVIPDRFGGGPAQTL
jgi:SPP1 gp7 family putative phage head morphogenesis protein